MEAEWLSEMEKSGYFGGKNDESGQNIDVFVEASANNTQMHEFGGEMAQNIPQKSQFWGRGGCERCEKCVFLVPLAKKKVKCPQHECGFCYGVEYRDKGRKDRKRCRHQKYPQ